MKIAYQGIEGSYSHQALLQFEGEKKGFSTFRAVYQAVEEGKAELGLLPIENTLAGTIYETIDLLTAGGLHIVGELCTRVDHHLLALPGAKIKRVLSHPKALAQCRKIFEEHPEWIEEPYYDTAGAAAEIARSKDLSLAAIASRSAGEIYQLESIRKGIQDHSENYTRFFLISRTPSKGNKKSISFTLDHEPGKLAERLNLFAKQGINLTYIVSRPVIGKPFEYSFYLDLQTDAPWPEIEGKLLGTYETLSDWNYQRKS